MRVSTLGFQTDASNQMQSLEAEITRARTQIAKKQSTRAAADALFARRD